MTFDVIKYCIDFKIQYWETGKNVTKGWIGVTCPFCDDTSNHCGIHLEDGRVKCWKCGKHLIVDLISRQLKLPMREAFKVYKLYKTDSPVQPKEEEAVDKVGVPCLQPFIEPLTPNNAEAWDYLKRVRKYNPFDLVRDYHLMWGGRGGFFKYRIVIPSYVNGIMISATGMAIRKGIDPKYKFLPREPHEKYHICSQLSESEFVYNIDSITTHCIIVEGITDVWRLGKQHAVATFGIDWDQAQVQMVAQKRCKKYLILFDPEPQAQRRAKQYAQSLSYLTNSKIHLIENSSGNDPDKSTPDELSEILKILYK